MAYLAGGILLYGSISAVLFLIRPKSRLHRVTMETLGQKEKIAAAAVMLLLILACVIPMGWVPGWTGQEDNDRNQYELTAEAFLNGRLYIDSGDVDPRLTAMENPYDPAAREELGVDYRWDTVYYNGHYYMYFGVVPVVLLFLPFRILTGTALAAYHATQVFVALFIPGMFACLAMISRRFFAKLSFGMYLFLAAAFSAMSVWYSVTAPALYCTAITAALCMEIWSLFFFFRAVWVERDEKKQILLAFFGSLFGALAFGCRPPIALANLFVLPMLAEYLRGKKFDFRMCRRLVFAASPYVFVAVLLMCYNYARFGSVFEFGQAYQLTNTDQTAFGGLVSYLRTAGFAGILNGIYFNFLYFNSYYNAFPYVAFCGIFLNFPILFFMFFGLAPEGVWKRLKEQRLRAFVGTLFLIPLVIVVMQLLWSPYLMERYRMDQYWIMGVLCFLVIGFYYETLSERARKRFSCLITLLAFLAVGKCVLLYLVQSDGNLTVCYPQVLEEIKQVLKFGIGG